MWVLVKVAIKNSYTATKPKKPLYYHIDRYDANKALALWYTEYIIANIPQSNTADKHYINLAKLPQMKDSVLFMF
jgi:hypothetical protein